MDLQEVLSKHNVSLETLKDQTSPEYLIHKERVLALYKEGCLQEQHIKAIAQTLPDLAKALVQISDGMKASQLSISQTQKAGVEGITNVLSKLAEKAASDEAIIKLAEQAEKINRNNNDTSKEINRNNNKAWKWAVGAVLTLSASIAYAAGKIK